MQKSDSIQNLAAALVKAQTNIGGAIKSATNPHFKSAFANLGEVIFACKGALADQGIAVSQMLTAFDNGAPGLETILLHESGEWISSTMPVICAKKDDPQAFGSACTYAKRYALQAALLVPSVDDDGEAAMFRNDKPEQHNPQPPIPGIGKKVMFPNGDPRQVVVHVGVNTGLRLHELNPKQIAKLDTEWRESVETDGSISEQDQLLLDALTFCRRPTGGQAKAPSLRD